MSPLETLGFALGTSFASGLNLYATVAAAGLFQRFGVITLPEPLQVLAHPMVVGLAVALFVIEFVADKIPYVDSVWDAVHTLHPSAGRRLPLLQRIRGRRPGAVQDRGGPARRHGGPDLAWGQGHHARGREREP